MVFIFTDSIFLLQNTICKYRNIFDSVFLLNTTCIYIYALYFLLYIDCGLFRLYHTSSVRSIAVENFFTAKAKALCCYGKFPILSEVKLSERKGHFTHTSAAQSIAVESFFTAKTKALCCYGKFPILSEVKLSEGKGHFTHTSAVQSIAVGSFFTAKAKAAV